MKNWEIAKAFEEGESIERSPTNTEYRRWYQVKSDEKLNWVDNIYRLARNWQPEGIYFAVDLINNKVILSENQHGSAIKHSLLAGLTFETEEKARQALKDYRFYHRLYKLAEELNDGWIPDWKDESEYKYFIEFDREYETYSTVSAVYHAIVGAIYFKSKECADQAILHLQRGEI